MTGHKKQKIRIALSMLLVALMLAAPLTAFADTEVYNLEMESLADLEKFLSDSGGGAYSILVKNNIDFGESVLELTGISVSLSFTAEAPVSFNQSGTARHMVISGGSVGITLNNVSLDGSGTGGGIEVKNSATLSFSGAIKNCTAEKGGAIYASGGSLTITGSSFIGNSAKVGGAIYLGSDSHLSAWNTSFSGNSATSVTAGGNANEANGGGAAALEEGTYATFNSCTFTGNSATARGGAIDLLRVYHFNMIDCENCVPYYNDLTLTNCAFSGNSCGSGGYLDAEDNPELYEIYGNKVTGLASASVYGCAYNNYDVCYISDFMPPAPPEPPAIKPDYKLTVKEDLIFPVSDTYPEKIDRSLDWAEFAKLLEPKVYDLSGNEILTKVSLSCAEYESAVNYWRPGDYEITVEARFAVGIFQYEKTLKLKVTIEDTIAPVVKLGGKEIVLPRGQSCGDIDELLALVTYMAYDNTGESPEVYAKIVAFDFSEINWSEPSEYGVYVYARDLSGNEAVRTNFILKIA